jgi:histidyl-tRNA synthetase
LGFEDFVIKVNHRKVLTGILQAFGVPDENHIGALIALDKLDKIGEEGVYNELIQRGVSNTSSDELINFFRKFNQVSSQIVAHTNFEQFNKDCLEMARETLENFEAADQGLDELEAILKFSMVRVNQSPAIFDPSLARGLSYYTGAIFEINVPDFAGSLAGGGRYDGLIGMFGKEAIPACGLSIGLERILVVMEERGMFDKLIAEGKLKADSADVLVTIWNEESVGESLKLAGELRNKGLRVLVYPEADKLGKQFKYASQVGVSFVCVLGETELAENKVTLKNMQTGEQETLLREDVAGKIRPVANGDK